MMNSTPSKAWPVLRMAQLEEGELRRIPSKGGVVLLLDALLSPESVLSLWESLQRRRADLAIAGIPERISKLPDWMSESLSMKKYHVEWYDIVKADQHLQQGGALILFPQHKESQRPFAQWGPYRGRWKKKWLQLIRKSGAPVIPVQYPEGAREVAVQAGTDFAKPLQGKLAQSLGCLRIGNRITALQVSRIPDDQHLDRHLSARLYSLSCIAQVSEGQSASPWLRVIHTPFDRQTLEREVAALPPENLLLEQGSFKVIEAGAAQIPHLIHEIGRQRELAFQAVGEGSARMIDLDQYDAQYRHLFAWDSEKNALAGAYRLGPGDVLLRDFGKRGFYLHSLFHLKDEFLPVLAASLELGRSFVALSYQQQRLPLFILWKGVQCFIRRHPQYRWLIGPVSISNQYSAISRSVMVHYIQRHYYDHQMAALVRARKAFVPNFGGLDADALLAGSDANPATVDALIADIEPAQFRLPVLLKKYFAQNARIIGFNVDPAFSNALDGFMVCRIADLSDTFR